MGSLTGNVTLNAGNDYRQTASDVRAVQGDIAITAANVTIDTADNTSSASQDLRMRQSGVSVTFSSPIVNALQGVVATIDAAGQTKDERTQALAAASTAMAAYNLAQTITKASALNIAVSVGNSRSQSHSEQSGSMAAASSIEAGGNLTIKATGKEPGQGNITAIGANLSAGNNATLDATNDIDLRAAQNSANQTSTNSSCSASVGIGINLGGTQNGITINAAASQARGNANGTDTTNTLTTVSAGNGLTLNSGRDTSLIGATASGNQVTANVGGSLDIQSVQDTSTYTSRQQSAGVGVSICVPPICYGASSASVSLANSGVNGDFASVTTQSGIKAGDGGFNLNVGGNTNLTGAAITSSQAAVDAGKNSLSTNALTQSSIGNSASADASQISLSASYSGEQTSRGANGETVTARNADGTIKQAGVNGYSASPPLVLSASDSDASTTRSALSGATVTIRSGDTTALSGVNRNAVTGQDTSNAIVPVLSQAELQARMQVAQGFVQQAGALIDNMGQQADRLRDRAEQAERAGNADEAQRLRTEAQGIEANWGPGGAYRQGLTALAAAAGGNVIGGAGRFAQAAVVNYMQQQGAEAIGNLVREGAVEEGSPAHAALHALVGCAGAAGSGQSCGAGAMGGAASSLLTNLFEPPKEGESQQNLNARSNLIATLSTAVAGAAGTSAQNLATVNSAATAATDNNYLTQGQMTQFAAELRACRQRPDCKQDEVYARWTQLSNQQQRASFECVQSGDPTCMGPHIGGAVTGWVGVTPQSVCELGDSKCYQFVLQQQNQARAAYQTQLAGFMTHDVLESGVGQSAGRVVTGEDTTGAKPPAASSEQGTMNTRRTPVGDEDLPNVYDNQRQGVDKTPLPPNVPPKAGTVVEYVVNNNGAPPPGYVGGRNYMNDRRGGGEKLPTTDAAGAQIIYREYDVNPRQPGVNRGTERVVVGSDGSAYYTNNHYTTFTRITP